MSFSSVAPTKAKPKMRPKMFKKLDEKTVGGGDDSDLGFFSRSKDNFIMPEEVVRRKDKEKVTKTSADGSPPKKLKITEEEDEDSGDAGRYGSTRRRLNNHHADTSSDENLPPRKSKQKSKPTRARRITRSITPPPILYNDPDPPPQKSYTNYRHETTNYSTISGPTATTRTAFSFESDNDEGSLPVPPKATDDDDDDVVLMPIKTPPPPSAQEEDDIFAAIEARARARARLASTPAPRSGSTPTSPPSPEPVISILITSEIPKTAPLIVKRRLGQNIRDVRTHWCKRQGFTPDQTADIFLTWKGNRVYDYVSCRGIGVGIDESGNLISGQQGSRNGNVHFEAVNAQTFEKLEREREAGYNREPQAEEEEQPAKAEEATLRLTLKSKGLEDYKIKAKPDTQISRLISAFRITREIDDMVNVTLYFDGEPLDPEETVADTELEDMFSVDVYLK